MRANFRLADDLDGIACFGLPAIPQRVRFRKSAVFELLLLR